jgi:hypothetical protein
VSALTHKPWSAEEDAALLSLRAAGLKWHAIAKRLRRTESSAVSRAVKLRAEQTRHHRAGTLLESTRTDYGKHAAPDRRQRKD